MSPSQKVGMERATMEPKVSRWSKSEYWRTALTIPVKSPSPNATENALTMSTMVAGMRSTMISRTSRPSRYDRPQLPVRTPPPELAREPIEILGAHRRGHRVDRRRAARRQMQHREADERHEHEHDDRLENAAKQVPVHARLGLPPPLGHVPAVGQGIAVELVVQDALL